MPRNLIFFVAIFINTSYFHLFPSSNVIKPCIAHYWIILNTEVRLSILSAKTHFGICTRTLCLHLGLLSRIYKRKNKLIEKYIMYNRCVGKTEK